MTGVDLYEAAGVQPQQPLDLYQAAGIAPDAVSTRTDRTTGQLIGRTALRTVKDAAAGAASIGDLVNAPINAASEALGSDFRLDSPSRQVSDYFDKATEGSALSTAPESGSDRVGDTAAEFVSSALVPGGAAAKAPAAASTLSTFAPSTVKGLTSLASGGVGAGALHEAFPDSTIAPIAGAVVGSLLPEASSLGLANPDAYKAGLAQKAVDMGIPLRSSQIGSSKFAKGVAAVTKDVPLSGAVKFGDQQQSAFNKAITNTIGEGADKITPDVIDSAYKNIGQKFDQALAGRTITVGDGIQSQLDALDHDASQSLDTETYGIVKKRIESFRSNIGGDGTISGEKINSFRSSLAASLKRMQGDAAPYLRDLQDTVIDASVEGGPPGTRELLNTARSQYKNLKTIEPLAAKAADGNISPALLLNQVRTNFGNFARGGGGDLGDLARIGQAFLKDQVPNSGTAGRAATYGLLGGGALTHPLATGSAVGTSAAFNALDTAQPLVKAAIKRGTAPASPIPAGALATGLSGMNAPQPQQQQEEAPAPQQPISGGASQPTTGGNIGNDTLGSASGGDYLTRLAMAESSMNPKAKAATSSAKGLFQFTDGTWNALVKKYGPQVGVKASDRMDPQAQAIMAQVYTSQNAAQLAKKLGRQPNDADLYAAHFLGAYGAAKLINNLGDGTLGKDLFPKEARANRPIFFDGRRPRTADEVYGILAGKIGQQGI